LFPQLSVPVVHRAAVAAAIVAPADATPVAAVGATVVAEADVLPAAIQVASVAGFLAAALESLDQLVARATEWDAKPACQAGVWVTNAAAVELDAATVAAYSVVASFADLAAESATPGT